MPRTLGRYFPRTYRHLREFKKLMPAQANEFSTSFSLDSLQIIEDTQFVRVKAKQNKLIWDIEVTSFGFVSVQANQLNLSEVSKKMLEFIWAIYFKQAKASAAQISANVVEYGEATHEFKSAQAKVQVGLDSAVMFLDKIGKMNRLLFDQLQASDFSKASIDKAIIQDRNFVNLPILENRIEQARINLAEFEKFYAGHLSKSQKLKIEFGLVAGQAEYMKYLVRTSYDTFKNKYDMFVLQKQLRVARLALWISMIATAIALLSLVLSLGLLDLSWKFFVANKNSEILLGLSEINQNQDCCYP